MFAAIRLASSLLSKFAAERRPAHLTHWLDRHRVLDLEGGAPWL